MFLVRIAGLTVSRAEELLADIWCALEDRNVASPTMSIDTEVVGRWNILLTFRTQEDASLVMGAVAMMPPDDVKAPLLMAAGWAN